MSDDRTMLLVGAAILIGAFYAFKEEKKSEETTPLSNRPATQPGAGEAMETCAVLGF